MCRIYRKRFVLFLVQWPMYMLFYNKPFLQIDYNYVLNCIVHTWQGYFMDFEYQEAMNRSIEAIIQTGATSMIINLVNLRQDEIQEINWTTGDWLPRMFETEIQKIAIILAPTAFTHVCTYEVPITYNEHMITLCYFDSLEDAKIWMYYS